MAVVTLTPYMTSWAPSTSVRVYLGAKLYTTYTFISTKNVSALFSSFILFCILKFSSSRVFNSFLLPVEASSRVQLAFISRKDQSPGDIRKMNLMYQLRRFFLFVFLIGSTRLTAYSSTTGRYYINNVQVVSPIFRENIFIHRQLNIFKR